MGGPTSGGRQRRMGFRRAPRAVQDRMKKMTERTHFPRAEEACRADLGGRVQAGTACCAPTDLLGAWKCRGTACRARSSRSSTGLLNIRDRTYETDYFARYSEAGRLRRPARPSTSERNDQTNPISRNQLAINGLRWVSGTAGRSDSARPDRSLHGDTRRHRTQTGWPPDRPVS